MSSSLIRSVRGCRIRVGVGVITKVSDMCRVRLRMESEGVAFAVMLSDVCRVRMRTEAKRVAFTMRLCEVYRAHGGEESGIHREALRGVPGAHADGAGGKPRRGH